MGPPVEDFNSGQLSRNERIRASLMRKIQFQDGCWRWTGELNYADSPILRLGGDAVDAADAVWEAWRRSAPPAKRCRNRLCVNPGCRE